MSDRRNALLWALAWWLFRRQVRRRASFAVSEIGAVATPRRRFGVVGVLVLVALAVGAFVAWRRLAGDDDGWDSPPFEPEPAPQPPVPVAA